MDMTPKEALVVLAGVFAFAVLIFGDLPSDAELAGPIEVVTVDEAIARDKARATTTTTEPRPVTTTAVGVWVDSTTTSTTTPERRGKTTTTPDSHDTESSIPDHVDLPEGISIDPNYDPGTFKCWEWMDLAVAIGWKEDRLRVLDDILWDESRCDPTQVNTSSSDWGLLQINRGTWDEYVGSYGYEMDDLLVPTLNLWFGLQIANMAEYDYGWRWCQPWDNSQARTCPNT